MESENPEMGEKTLHKEKKPNNRVDTKVTYIPLSTHTHINNIAQLGESW